MLASNLPILPKLPDVPNERGSGLVGAVCAFVSVLIPCLQFTSLLLDRTAPAWGLGRFTVARGLGIEWFYLLISLRFQP